MQCLIKEINIAINIEKCERPVYTDSSNEYHVTKKHMTKIFNIRLPKPMLSYMCDRDILLQIYGK